VISNLDDLLTSFGVVFVAELPDKTMIATVVLTTRHRIAWAVWLGVVAAFAVHVTVAVLAGSVIGRLPSQVVDSAVALLFAIGAVLMFRASRESHSVEGDQTETTDTTPRNGARKAMVQSFLFVGLAEWGDLTQLATASFAARAESPSLVWIGAFVALATVAGIAAVAGRYVVAHVPLHRLNLAAAVIFAALSGWTFLSLVR
jgi:putative Ca2+/H+ antiporter (TMEM165/GDT1 family)